MRGTEASDRTRFLGEGRIGQLIRRLSIPAIATMVLIAVFQLIDAAFIGILGTAQLGAVSVAFPLFTVVAGIGQTFGTGTASVVSRHLGAGEHDRADRIASASLIGVAVAGAVIALVVNLTLDPLLDLLGGSETILEVGTGYARILVFANMITMVNVTMTSIIRAEGNVKRGMYSVFLSAGLNVALDPLFIFGFDLGLAGAAVATLVSQAASFCFLSSTFLRRRNNVRIDFRAGFSDLRRLSRVLVLGTPTFLLQFLGAAAIALINVAAGRYGDGAIAAVGLTFRILSVGMFAVYGFTTGFQPVVGFNYGARSFERVFASIRTAVGWASAFAVVFTLTILLAAPLVVSAFTTDPVVREIGVRMLRAVVSTFPLFSVQIVLAVLFQALGHALPAALIVLARQGIFFIPGVLLLPRLIGLDGVVLTQPVSDLLTSVLAAVFAVVILRRLRKESISSAATS